MLSILKWYAFIGLVVVPVVPAQRNQTRIVGDSMTIINRKPYVVQVFYGNDFICGGSILTKMWIIATARCVNKNPNRFIVHGGSSVFTGGISRRVQQILEHPDYNSTTFDFNIAMLKLCMPLIGRNIKPIPLCTVKVPSNHYVKVSGWRNSSPDGMHWKQMRFIKSLTINAAKCQEKYNSVGFVITPGMICASRPGTDSCYGSSSGGPLVYGGKLCGIESLSIEYVYSNFPNIYTNIIMVKPFINRIMANY